MAGGTSFYFSNAIRNMNVDYTLVTALAESEMHVVEELRAKGIDVNVLPSTHTVYFENNYTEKQDHRTQREIQKPEPITAAKLLDKNGG